MKIASWNVNSLKVRMPHLTDWLKAAQPDVVGLQEIKLTDEAFPHAEIRALGYHALASGQKTYNGVALLSRELAKDAVRDIPGFEDPQRRVLAATIGGIRVINLYVVNGQSVGSDKFHYKLDWLAALKGWLEHEVAQHPRLVVMGDFNIAPDDRDVHDPALWYESVMCSTPERSVLGEILGLGLTDSFRLQQSAAGHYSWWDYRMGAFRRNIGLRIDLVLVSPALVGDVQAAGIDREPRRWERPSDHAPVWVELKQPDRLLGS
jgi:exodeoxyribonuclease-3